MLRLYFLPEGAGDLTKGMIMRLFTGIQVSALVLALGLTSCTYGGYSYGEFVRDISETGDNLWVPAERDTVRPLLNVAKPPHNVAWDKDQWRPELWTESRDGDQMAVINGFYEAGIVLDQTEETYGPVLIVGQAFIELSPQEQRRVAAYFDDVFKVTETHPTKSYRIDFLVPSTHLYKRIGRYTQDGLQLQ